MTGHFYALSNFIAAFLTILLGIYVFIKNIKGRSNRIFLIFCCVFSSWMFSLFFLYYFGTSVEKAVFWSKSIYIGACFSPVLSYHFIIAYLNIKKRPWVLYLFYALSSLFLFLTYTNSILNGVHLYSWGFYPLYGKSHPFFIAYLLIENCYTLYLLYNKYQHRFEMTSQDFMRVKYVFIAWIIGHFALINFLPTYGLKIYPAGNFFIAILVVVLTYTIIRHQLLDIKIIIKKTLLYSLTLTSITIIYFLAIYTLEKTFSIMIGYKSTLMTLFIIVIFSIVFIPLKNKIQYLIDKYFFHGSIGQIDEENTLLREEIQKSEKMKAVATLAAGMAHEIKNPLTSIKTFTEYIKTKQNDPDFIDKFQQIVGSEVDKIDSIVKQLLEFSKPQELQLKETDINKLLDETLNLLNNDLLKHNIKTEKNYSTLSTIKVDPVQIKQVFLNLLLNAIDAIDKDGKITISTNITDNDQICITIEDTGKGISKEDLKHVFDPFFTKKDSGTGLGLSIVHGIIEKHGGDIKAHSKISNGANFIIKL